MLFSTVLDHCICSITFMINNTVNFLNLFLEEKIGGDKVL